MDNPESIGRKLTDRTNADALRVLSHQSEAADFSSNDYLGFASSEIIFNQTHQYLIGNGIIKNGATGSRLISGNHQLYNDAELIIAEFHRCESALIFNSGYDANLGFFSSVPQRNDLVLFDELSHASIRDGIRLSNAKAIKFTHNDLDDLESIIVDNRDSPNIYIVTESVFSMDGDSPDLLQLVELSEKYNCFLIVDEAHALGVFGKNGEGLVNELDLHKRVFARIVTFGKGLGCHGAAILGSAELRSFLVNFARSFIYTTALPPHSVANIIVAYKHLRETAERELLKDNMIYFNQEMNMLGVKQIFVGGKSAIKSAIIPGNENVKSIAIKLTKKGFDVKAILSPTVPPGQERLRICLHSFNSTNSIRSLLLNLKEVLF